MPAPRPAVRRRTALGGALGGALASVAAAAGCDAPPEWPAAGRSRTPDLDARPGGVAAGVDADLVERVVAETAGLLALVGRARRADRPALTGLEALHRGHLRVLEARPGPTRAPATRPGLARVRSGEEQLQRLLASSAVQARSGALAQLLASMSAAVAQHLAVLPASPPPRLGRRGAS